MAGARSEDSGGSHTAADNDGLNHQTEGKLGTSNCKRRLDRCKANQPLKVSKSENTYDQGVFCSMIAKAIMHHGYSLKMVEDEHFREAISYLNPKVMHISSDIILKYCTKDHKKLKAQLCQLLSEVPGKICLTCNLWSASTSRDYLTLTAHFVDKSWKLRSKVLAFRYCPSPHDGADIYRFVLDLVDEWNLKGKVFSMTVGNASNMEVMVEELRKDLHSTSALPCDGKFFHIRCADQILNFVVQSGMKLIDESVIKLRETVRYIEHSNSALARFEQAIRDSQTNFSGKLRLDDPTRWDSTYSMLCECLMAKAPINKFASQEIGFEYILLEEEWKTVRNMCDFLAPFHKITLLFSGSEYPTANSYFVHIAMIETVLVVVQNKVPCCSIVQMAAPMLQMFEKYWNNYTLILSIAVLLDPRYKLRLVKHMYRALYVGQEWENKVKEVYDAFTELYTFYANSSTPLSTAQSSDSSKSPTPDVNDYFSQFLIKANIYQEDDEDMGIKPLIDSYLNSRCLPQTNGSDFDVLQYWESQSYCYPVLACMARDVLAIPITTVATASSFSMGDRLLTNFRSSPLPKNVEALITTQNWICGYGEVEKDTLEVI